MKTDKQ